tara:strand:- start:1306 stop:1617 length:312 start_codon:yes stop_codon:yes gene_type:complete
MNKIDKIVHDQVGSLSSCDMNMLEEVLDDIANRHIRTTNYGFDKRFADCHDREKLKVIYVLLYLMESGILDDAPIGFNIKDYFDEENHKDRVIKQNYHWVSQQ